MTGFVELLLIDDTQIIPIIKNKLTETTIQTLEKIESRQIGV
jgi:hypothetical protein